MSSPSHQAVKMLAELLGDEQCVLFLGNDLPLGHPDSAPPCRDELAAELARDLDLPPPAPGSLGKVALRAVSVALIALKSTDGDGQLLAGARMSPGSCPTP